MRASILALATGACLLACSTASVDLVADAYPENAPELEQPLEIVADPGLGEEVETEESDITFVEKIDQFSPDIPGLLCNPGEGCFLDKCQDNADCQSGWCVQHMGEGVCSESCQEECPEGWSCQQVAGSEPDVVFICVSNFANLCRPCEDSSGCNTTAAQDACVDYGEEGNFCGGACQAGAGSSEECPWGFSCQEVTTVDGIELMQCMNDAGVCPCTHASIGLGLWTSCAAANEFGSCPGKRVCVEGGLSECDAVVPGPEQCNGLDDNCNGELDEPSLVDGDYVNLCDDGNDCTGDSCAGSEGCMNPPLETGSCDDGDPCTVADHCEEGACVSLLVECADSNPCTEDLCTATGGCEFPPQAGPCDDGDPCTLADHCSEGECGGTAVPCDCQTDADCAPLEDGDVCNGTLICDTQQIPFKCVVDPETPIECPPATGVDAPCQVSSCDPVSGTCTLVPDHEGFPCVDEDECTVNSQCADGVCSGGLPVNCNDGNPCTDEMCDPAEGCLYDNNNSPCNDGSACTKSDACEAGECLGGPPLDCDDANVCTDDLCDQALGCHHEANDAPCDDGDACTTGDFCQEGQCEHSGAADCDDGNPCTTDFCAPGKGCQSESADGPCDDGNPCTLNDACGEGVCVPGAAVDCDDGNVCTDDSCSESGLCTHAANDAGCDDGNACTTGDHCSAGECSHEEVLNCQDEDVCTDSWCDPSAGCVFHTNTKPCEDGNPCTTGDSCADGACAGGPPLVCDDGNLCTDDTCLPDSGCVFDSNSLPCDDGNACTSGESCTGGWCGAGQMVDCIDDNLCTDDSCDVELGCVHTANGNPCDDENFCTVGDQCGLGVCNPGAETLCGDGNYCNGEEACDPESGCVAGIPPQLDDGVDCTVDACDPVLAEVTHVATDELCPAGGLCEMRKCDAETGCLLETVLDCCGNKILEDGEECDDGNEMNSDACLECVLAFCGDGVRHVGEEVCDGDELETGDCADVLGDDFVGLLACAEGCEYDTSACVGPIGTENNPAPDCLAILNAGDSVGDGVYFLAAGDEPVKAYCDMTGGGWTLVTSWPHEETPGVWGEFHLEVDSPTPGVKHAIPFRSIFPHPALAKLVYLGNGQALTFNLSPGGDWQVSDKGTRYPVTNGNYLIFEKHHCGGAQGVCVNNGSYSGGFNCDGDSGQIAGQGMFAQCTYNEFCNCGSWGWKYDAGGCTATVCSPAEQEAVYLK